MSFRWINLCIVLSLLWLTGCPSTTQENKLAGEKFTPIVYDYGGIRIVQVITPRDPVEIRLVFSNPNMFQNPAVANLGLRTALNGGTTMLSPDQFASALELEKARLSYTLGAEYCWLSLACLPERLESSWSLLQQCALSPGFDQEIFASEQAESKQKAKLFSQSPLSGLAKLVRSKGFGPFLMTGQLGSLGTETIPEYQDIVGWHQEKLLPQSQIALVVIGNIDGEQVADLLLQGLTEVSSTPWERAGVSPSQKPEPGIFLEKSPNDQEAIALFLPQPIGEDDAPEDRAGQQAAFSILGQCLAERVDQLFAGDPQTRANLQSGYHTGPIPGYWFSLSDLQVMPRAELIMSEVRKFYNQGFQAGEVRRIKQTLLNQQLTYLQSNREQADLWAREVAEKSLSNWGLRVNALQSFNEKELFKIAQFSIENLSWFYYGVPSRLDRNSLSRLN